MLISGITTTRSALKCCREKLRRAHAAKHHSVKLVQAVWSLEAWHRGYWWVGGATFRFPKHVTIIFALAAAGELGRPRSTEDLMSNRNVGEGRSNGVTGAHIITCSAGLRRSPAELRGRTRFDVLENLENLGGTVIEWLGAPALAPETL